MTTITTTGDIYNFKVIYFGLQVCGSPPIGFFSDFFLKNQMSAITRRTKSKRRSLLFIYYLFLFYLR
jgi:hypothetical protein